MRLSSQPTTCLGQVALTRTWMWTPCSRTHAQAGRQAAGKLRPAWSAECSVLNWSVYFLSMYIGPAAHVRCHTPGRCMVSPTSLGALCARLQHV